MIATKNDLLICPICGRKNRPEDTFRCKKCGKDDLCIRHQDEKTFLCSQCSRGGASTVNIDKPRVGLSEVRLQAMREKLAVVADCAEITQGPFISLNEVDRKAVLKRVAGEFHSRHPTWLCVPVIVETFSSWNPLSIPSGVKIAFGTKVDAYVEFKNKHEIHAVPFAARQWSMRIRLYGFEDKQMSKGPIFDKSFPLDGCEYDLVFVQLRPGVMSVKPTISLVFS